MPLNPLLLAGLTLHKQMVFLRSNAISECGSANAQTTEGRDSGRAVEAAACHAIANATAGACRVVASCRAVA